MRPVDAPLAPRPRSIVDRLGERARIGEPGRPTPRGRAFVRAVGRVMRVLFRPRLEGLERLPVGRPFLLVANHSGGGVAEICSLAALWQDAPGERPPLAGFAHALAFYVPGAATFLRAVGAIPSTYEHAARALASGVSVLVFPGGDHEAFRPIWRASAVDFGGRSGFARIARRARVPVVPLGFRGSHFTVPILWRSGLLAWLLVVPRAFGLKRVPITLLTLAGAVALAAALGAARAHPAALALALWAWCLFPVPWFLPLVPWPITMTIGDPIEPDALFSSFDEAAPVDAAARRVEAAVQALVTPASAARGSGA